MSLKENLQKVIKNIKNAADCSGRNAGDVSIIAVTKTVGVAEINEILGLGIKNIGENRVQDSLKKYPETAKGAVWHMIGHLQTNKVKDAVKIFDCIHSVDSVKLASVISQQAANIGKKIDILVEVNAAQEETKYGLKENEVESSVREMAQMKNINVVGLMTMAPIVGDPEETRPYFRRLKELKDRINSQNIPNISLRHLSMGMSQDYMIAVQEEATFVRIGTALFV